MALLSVFWAAACARPKAPGPDVPARAPLPAAPAVAPESAAETQTFVADPHSFARPAEARVTHVALDLKVDFATRTLAGTALLSIAHARGAREIVLDTKDLEVSEVADGAGRPLAFAFGKEQPLLGRPLSVRFAEPLQKIVIRYRTSPSAGALQWLTPEQTAGKRHPYLFSQGQPILTRTWIPTQDSPGIRQSYEAVLRVPEPLTALMSAERSSPSGADDCCKRRSFSFRAKEPIPPYLIALAVGDIAFRPLGPRTGVYAEPVMLERAAYEFSDLEKMLETAESIGGAYRWGRYDILVLPPSFPFGGMENPRLTFATPTIIAGDRSLVSLAAHELAHSWSGNLVTNATWGDIWLNEGFTSYFELRIMEALRGPDHAAMLELLGRNGLEAELKELAPADTVLSQDLTGRDPDGAGGFAIPYDKGAAFLRTLEAALGRQRFDKWLFGYFERHAFSSVTSAELLNDLREHVFREEPELEVRLRVKEWMFEPGLPDNAYRPVSNAFANVEAQADAFLAGKDPKRLEVAGWSPQQWQHFLETLFRKKVPRARAAELDWVHALSASGNSEILFAWLRVAIQCRYEKALPALEQFLTSQGRRKFLRPLYADLLALDWGRPLARRIYERARPGYHPVSSDTIDQLMREAGAR